MLFENMLLNAIGKAGLMPYVTTAWDMSTFLKKSTTTLKQWIGYIFVLVGVVAIGYAVWQIVTGLISHGKKQTNWALSLILLMVGGILVGSGSTGEDSFKFVTEIAGGGKQTIKDLGEGN